MKQLLIFCLFLLPCFSQGQITVYNSSLKDTTKNELYWGLDNIICIKGVDDSKNDITIKMTNGKIEKLSKGHYNVSLKVGPGYAKRDTLNIFKKGTLVFSKSFDLNTIPDSYLQFGNRRDSIMSVQEALISPSLKIIIPKFNYKNFSYRFYIHSFEIKIHSNQNERPYERDAFSNLLSKEDISEIRKLNSGDKIIFNKIRVVDNIGNDREFGGPFIITIE